MFKQVKYIFLAFSEARWKASRTTSTGIYGFERSPQAIPGKTRPAQGRPLAGRGTEGERGPSSPSVQVAERTRQNRPRPQRKPDSIC